MRPYSLILCILLILPAVFRVQASHIVGGEVYYTCVNGGTYQIQLIIYQDCFEGEQTAIRQDTPAFIGVFNLANGTGSVGEVPASSSIAVPANFQNECVNNPPTTCLNKVTFNFEMTLQPNVPYRVVYMRCCRNASIQNISQPGTTGATYFCDIPPVNVAACNSSAVFKNFPPQIICVNNPLRYDHSATDADGDSLSYEFCEAYQGGEASINDPKPKNLKPNLPPPVVYISPYSAAKPILGNPALQINPVTGMISGTPNLMGRYVVAVCCNEWRNGVKINTTRREFQFNVTNCSKAVVANIPQFSDEFNTYIVECSSRAVKFINNSTGGFRYKWEFGVPGATSEEFEPTFEYPDTGTYVVRLTVNEGSTCPDTISRFVKIFPDYRADFEVAEPLCPNAPVQFFDRSVATFPPVVGWAWQFGDGNTSSSENPVNIYPIGGTYSVTLTSESIKGCRDTITKPITIEDFKPFAGNDTFIVRGEFVDFNAIGGASYLWTPSDGLNSATISNPRGFFPDTGTFSYNVRITSAGGCEGNDSINVNVVAEPYLFVPSAFSPNTDGLNDILRPLGAGYKNIRFFRIFNRWGQLMFDTNQFDDGWDGSFNGNKAEMGVYFWVLGVTDRFGQEQQIKGDVTLIR